MRINYQEGKYKRYGTCLFIDNGYLELIVTLDIGPRVISLRRLDGVNVFFEDLEDLVTYHSPKMQAAYGADAMWHGYGGHRIWSAPEDPITYFPDNDPVSYQVDGHRFIFTPPRQRYTGLQMAMTIDVLEENLIKVSSRITNHTDAVKRLSVWSLNMIQGPGLEIVPLPLEDTDFYPQRLYALWSFGAKNNDERVYYGDKYFTLKVEPENLLAYKVGMKVTGEHLYFMNGKDLFKLTLPKRGNGHYPDENVNYETYTKGAFMEMESLSALHDLQPETSVELYEYWRLYPFESVLPDARDEQAIEQVLLPFSKTDTNT